MLLITITSGYIIYYGLGYHDLDFLGQNKSESKFLNIVIPLIILGDIISMFKNTFRKNLASVFVGGFLNTILDIILSYFFLNFIFNGNSFNLG